MSITLLQPTDEQLDHLWDSHGGMPTERRPLEYSDLRAFARAVLAAAQPAPVPKPVPLAWGAASADGKIYIVWHERTDACTIPLYTHPAAPVSLTADDIWLLWTRACEKPQLTRDLVCDFARAIEAAHGIAASPEVPNVR
jgi:hypothetical protein